MQNLGGVLTFCNLLMMYLYKQTTVELDYRTEQQLHYIRVESNNVLMHIQKCLSVRFLVIDFPFFCDEENPVGNAMFKLHALYSLFSSAAGSSMEMMDLVLINSNSLKTKH